MGKTLCLEVVPLHWAYRIPEMNGTQKVGGVRKNAFGFRFWHGRDEKPRSSVGNGHLPVKRGPSLVQFAHDIFAKVHESRTFTSTPTTP